MGQQHKKVIKRTRRKNYLKRKKEQAKLSGVVKKRPGAKKAAAKKAPAKKAAAKKTAKKAPAKKAPAKKTAAKKEGDPSEEE
ncbi:hypothetical protein [Haloferula sargassicola]|uniref:Uncharacterized protein n=1 Tax=Haloferula sargassicola TaxID=490096 RepID=A0ABP9UTU7_9BACT